MHVRNWLLLAMQQRIHCLLSSMNVMDQVLLSSISYRHNYHIHSYHIHRSLSVCPLLLLLILIVIHAHAKIIIFIQFTRKQTFLTIRSSSPFRDTGKLNFTKIWHHYMLVRCIQFHLIS